jgi:regulator of replication initiation timing
MSNNINKSEETNWSEYESWVDGNLPKESISDCILRLSKQVAKLEYENARLKDDIQNLNEEIESLDGENFKLHHKIEFMEKI